MLKEGVCAEEEALHRIATTMPGVDEYARAMAFEQLDQLASKRLVAELTKYQHLMVAVAEEPEDWSEAGVHLQDTLNLVSC